ncbi:MAG TPA: shikimate kinase [Alkalispirochaeta sp.]|nr:shikimate kinase [Alkalispirochaeta sp.]
MNLYLSGMIGSGKTTIGTQLAARLNARFLDLDQEMDQRLGYSFHRLVKEQGWLPFRELEYAICKYFAGFTGAVVSLGGGTVRYEWNRDVIAASGVTVLLEASEAELIHRVARADRPRVNSGADLSEDVHRLWSLHAETYRSAADLIFSTEGKELSDEVAELEHLIRTDPRLRPVRSFLP